MNIRVDDNNEVLLGVQNDEIDLRAGDTINIGTSDYEDLTNKPSIEGTELVGDVSLEDIGAAAFDEIPTKVSELENDTGFITGYTETDPTVPAWAKAPNKPTYTASEVHALPDTTEIPTLVSDLENDEGFITEDDIPPEVTDLGNIDPSEYDDDLEVFLDTLLDNGKYRFLWEDGDDFEYFVEIQSLVENGNGYLLQHYWYSEEGAKYQYNRSAYFEAGECTGSDIDNYMTQSDANSSYATKNHSHYEAKSMAMTVWDFCDDELDFDNGKPYLLYADTLNDKNWLIERYSSMRSPNQRYIRLYELDDASHFYLRSGLYQSGVITWGNWEEIKPGTDEQVKQQYQAESGYTYWRPLVIGKSSNATEGFTPSSTTDQTYTFKTLEVQPSTGTIRMGVASMFNGSYTHKVSPTTLTANRTATLPNKSGTIAMTSDIPTDTSDLTNNAGFITLADLPIYNGGVS